MSQHLDSLLDAQRRADCAKNDATLSDWHRRMADSIAAAHPLTPVVRIKATGQHRVAENDEPEVDRGPLTMPAEISEADWIAADRTANEQKGQKWHQRNDAAARVLDLQHVDAMRRAGL